MPQFKVLDLMINIMPGGTLCRGVTLPNCKGGTLLNCNGNTYVGCRVTVCPNVTRCPPVTLLDVVRCEADGGSSCNACVTSGGVGTGGCKPGTNLVEHADLQLEYLGILKEQLKESLAQVEAQEQALEESLRPRAPEEFQLLEAKLAAALEELKVRRAELG